MAEKNSNGAAKPEEIGEKVTVSEVIESVGTPHETIAEPEVTQGLSLVEEFQAQALGAADIAAPEAEIVDGKSIKDEILDHLQFQDKAMWSNISPLLKMISVTKTVDEIKEAIAELVAEKKIKYHANSHEMWGTPSGYDKEGKTIYHSIENLNLYVKLV